MTRQFFGVLVLLASAPVLTAAGPQDSACLIEFKSEADSGAGSGTVIASENGKSLILSAAHVCPGEGEYTVTLSGKKYKAKYLTGSKLKVVVNPDGTTHQRVDGVDLALLVADAVLPVAPVATEALKKGDAVSQWGFAGGPPQAHRGPFHKVGVVESEAGMWASADARPGDSGSGLFNDKGQLAGVTYARSADDDEPGVLATPLPEVRKFLAEKAKGFPAFEKTLKPKK